MFGYQVDVAAEAAPVKSGKTAASAVYTLKPQHADDESARFQFRMTGSQQMQLLPSKFVQRCLHKEVETFIDRWVLQDNSFARTDAFAAWVAVCLRILDHGVVVQVPVHSSIYSQLYYGTIPEADPVLMQQ